MTYKRLVSILLALVLALALAACGESGTAETAQSVESQEPAAAGTEELPEEDLEPQPVSASEDPSLTRLREEIRTTGNLMGVAYLGTLSEGGQDAYDQLASRWLDVYPFLASLNWEDAAVNSGMEVYCVVPRDPGSQVAVSEWIIDESNGYRGEAGALLYEKATGERCS